MLLFFCQLTVPCVTCSSHTHLYCHLFSHLAWLFDMRPSLTCYCTLYWCRTHGNITASSPASKVFVAAYNLKSTWVTYPLDLPSLNLLQCTSQGSHINLMTSWLSPSIDRPLPEESLCTSASGYAAGTRSFLLF